MRNPEMQTLYITKYILCPDQEEINVTSLQDLELTALQDMWDAVDEAT
jgi:hypothetical protein